MEVTLYETMAVASYRDGRESTLKRLLKPQGSSEDSDKNQDSKRLHPSWCAALNQRAH